MNNALTFLPEVPEWISNVSLDKFIPFIIEVMTTASAGLYDFFVPLVQAVIWLLVGFNIALFVVKQFVPQNWLDFFGWKGGGEYYDNDKAAKLAWGVPTRLAKMVVRASLATTLLLALRPAILTETIINPFLGIGSMYTEFIMSSQASGEAARPGTSSADCNTNSFLSEDVCLRLANPISEIIYRNNQVVVLGMDMMGVPSFITDAGASRMTLDMGQNLFNFITGAVLVITFFLAGLYIASIVIQGILDFLFAVLMFPVKTLKWVMQTDVWMNPKAALEDVVASLRKLVVAMIIGGIMTIVNMTLISALFGGGVDVGLSSWSDKFMILLSGILCLVVMTKLFDIAREKLAKYGAPSDEFYKDITSNAQSLGKRMAALADNIKKMATKK
ncbi:MAG: hypothetical protein LBG89_00380 [Rickettsiales bacterium]|jgi:hypothetical protein|nr:hypothetical protein [Rickettsiales bacterium]